MDFYMVAIGMRKIYVDHGFLLAVAVIYVLSYLLSYIFQMIFHSALWVVYGSFLFITIVMAYSTRMFLLLLKSKTLVECSMEQYGDLNFVGNGLKKYS